MRLSIFTFLVALFISCSSAVRPKVPEIEPPTLPNNQSIVVEGVAGSTVKSDTLWSYVIDPKLLERGSNTPHVRTIKDWGINVIVADSVFNTWEEAHSLKVYVVLESKEIMPDHYYWFLTDVKSLGFRP